MYGQTRARRGGGMAFETCRFGGHEAHQLDRDASGRQFCRIARAAEQATAERREREQVEGEARRERARSIARSMAGDGAITVLELDDLLAMLTDAVLAGMAERGAR